MRIVDEWNQNKMKVTAFLMNGRYSVKLEQNLLEQTYKFRDDQITSVDQLKEKMNKEFYSDCIRQFQQMDINRLKLLPDTDVEDHFPSII